MEQDLLEKLEKMEKRIEETHALANKTYKIFLWTMIATVVMFVLPLIALIFVIPYFLNAITNFGGL